MALDIPEEKASVSKKTEKKAEKLFFEALSYLDKHIPEKALELLTQAFKLNPYDRRFWSVKSSLLFELGRHKEAYECGKEGLKYLQ
jgi:tetratricopeptide (TPR) repeat protein